MSDEFARAVLTEYSARWTRSFSVGHHVLPFFLFAQHPHTPIYRFTLYSSVELDKPHDTPINFQRRLSMKTTNSSPLTAPSAQFDHHRFVGIERNLAAFVEERGEPPA